MKGFIYKILNTKTGRFYIGSTTDLKKRRQVHLSDLKNGVHYNRDLQLSFDKHGRSAFRWIRLEVYEDITRGDLFTKEREYVERLSKEMCYNIHFTISKDRYEELKKPCYILDLSGNIVGRFDSKKQASEWLGLDSSNSLSRSTKNPKAKIKSKVDGSRYRVVNCDFYEQNRDLVLKYPGVDYFLYNGESKTIAEIAKLEVLSYSTVKNRCDKGYYKKV